MELPDILRLEPFDVKAADAIFLAELLEMQFSTVEFDKVHKLIKLNCGFALCGRVALIKLFHFISSNHHLLAIKVRITHFN
jgi:hypothetical protein